MTVEWAPGSFAETNHEFSKEFAVLEFDIDDPPEDPAAEESWWYLLQVVPQVMVRYRAAYRRVDLSSRQMDVLRVLEVGPASTATIASELGCRPPNVTRLVEFLESRELVAREPYRGVGHRRQVNLTISGECALDAFANRIALDVPSCFRALDDDEHRVLGGLLARMVAHDEAANAPPKYVRADQEYIDLLAEHGMEPPEFWSPRPYVPARR